MDTLSHKTILLVNTQKRNCQKGMSILVALMIIATLMMLATISLKTASDEIDIISHDISSLQAFYSAQTGLTKSIAILNNDRLYVGAFSGTIEITLNQDTELEERYSYYNVSIDDSDHNGFADSITSTGRYKQKQRKIFVKIISVNPLSLGKPREIRTY